MIYFIKVINKVFKLIRHYVIKLNNIFVLDKLKIKGGECDFKGIGFISCFKSLAIGNNVHIGEGFYFASEGGIIIGDNTHISRRVTIYTHNHNYNGAALPYDKKKLFKPVTIGKNVWIGMNVSICPGVTIGEGSIIGIGSVVTKDVAPYSISGGNPLNLLKYRNSDRYEYLENNSYYGAKNGRILDSNNRAHCSFYELEDNVTFVLSTGRSGSQAIVDTLSNHCEIEGYHEPFRFLIKLSTEYAHNIKSDIEVKSELRTLFTQISCFPIGKKIVVSDQKFSNLAHFIFEILPKAKYIHLKRNPAQCINSIYAREWYSSKAKMLKRSTEYWHQYRLSGFCVGAYSERDWSDLDRWEKCCWYYKYWNELIQKGILLIPDHQKITLMLEDFEENLDSLFLFLGVGKRDLNIKRSNKVQSAHLELYKRDWSLGQKDVFNKYFPNK